MSEKLASIPKILQPAPPANLAACGPNTKEVATTDNVNRPGHYTYGKIEPIDFIEDKGFNFNLGNVIKYVSRCGKKKSKGISTEAKALEDLKKARYYLEREIAIREKEIK